MADLDKNLFVRLSHWATRQGENFLTESLAITLTTLLENEPAAAARVLHRLTGGCFDLGSDAVVGVRLRTQVTTDSGRPDLEISVQGRLAFVEVKDEAAAGEGQLEGYAEDLKNSGVDKTQLIFLSRYRLEPSESRPDGLVEWRWFEIGDWLQEELAGDALRSEPTRFVVAQFVDFLRWRGLTMDKVDRGVVDGARAVNSLCELLYEAANRCGVTTQRQTNWGGVFVNLDETKFNVGFRLTSSDRIVFRTAQYAVDREAAERIGLGRVIESKWPKWSLGIYRWEHTFDLAADDGQFYRLTVEQQLHHLEDFIRRSLDAARQVEKRDTAHGHNTE